MLFYVVSIILTFCHVRTKCSTYLILINESSKYYLLKKKKKKKNLPQIFVLFSTMGKIKYDPIFLIPTVKLTNFIDTIKTKKSGHWFCVLFDRQK
jgi:hypothetical protein